MTNAYSTKSALGLIPCLSGCLTTASCSAEQPKPTIKDKINKIEKKCNVSEGSVRIIGEREFTNIILPCATDEENNCLMKEVAPLVGRTVKFSLSCYREVG